MDGCVGLKPSVKLELEDDGPTTPTLWARDPGLPCCPCSRVHSLRWDTKTWKASWTEHQVVLSSPKAMDQSGSSGQGLIYGFSRKITLLDEI